MSSTLLNLLLPAFLYSAVWVQLPAERRDARMQPEGVHAIARALSGSRPIREQLLAMMRAGDAQAAQVFWAALQIAQLPRAAASAASFADDMAARLFEQLSQLLNETAAVALSAWPPQQQRAAAEQLAAALAGLRAWAQLVGAGPRQSAVDTCCRCWSSILATLVRWSETLCGDIPASVPSADASDQVAIWCRAAVAALRCVPAVAQLAQQAQQGSSSAVGKLAGNLLLAYPAGCTVSMSSLILALQHRAPGRQLALVMSEERRAACSSAVHALHTALSRAMHWLLAGDGSACLSGARSFAGRVAALNCTCRILFQLTDSEPGLRR